MLPKISKNLTFKMIKNEKNVDILKWPLNDIPSVKNESK